MNKLKTLQFADDKLSRFQDNVSGALDSVTQCPLLSGVLVEGVPLAAGQDNQVGHQLDRNYRLWFVVKINANATIWEQTSADASRFVNLHTSAACTVSLWVA